MCATRFNIQAMSAAKRAQASRQQPGLACEACRSKKLRCDREQPQCGTCRAANIACVVDTDRLPRGRKGNVKSLQTKIGMSPSILMQIKRLTHSVNLTRRLADMERQQSEASSNENSDDTHANDMDEFMFDHRIQQGVTANSHAPMVQIPEKQDKRLENQGISSAASTMTFDASLEHFMSSQDMCAQPVHPTDRQDSVLEPRLYENLFLPNSSDPCPDTNMTTFEAQASLGGAVDMEPLKKTWSFLDLSDLICADL